MALTGVEAGDVMKVVLRWTLPDLVEANNTFYWYRSDSETDLILFSVMRGYLTTKLTALVQELDASIYDGVNATDFLLYTMKYVSGEWVTEGIGGEGTVNVDGLVAGDMAPHGVAGLVTYPTVFPGSRGRQYIPGLAKNAFDSSTLTAGTITVLEAYADEYLTTWVPVAGRTFVPSILSYKSATPYLLVSRKVSAYAAYQRRRGPGRGS